MSRFAAFHRLTGRIVVAAALGLAGAVANAASPSAPPDRSLLTFIPQTISPQARVIFEKLLPIALQRRAATRIPRTLAEFDARHDADVKSAEAGNAPLLQRLGVSTRDLTLGDVHAVETLPPDYRDDGTVLIHVHGGGWILGSARSNLAADALMATATGRRIVSVDYTVAPRGTWRRVTGQVIAVYRALLGEGYAPGSIGMFGDSAGGNIVPGSVLRLRDEGLPMPGALILQSPCTDVSLSGDTETTLRNADPALDWAETRAMVLAYAPRGDWRNPYVSPVYGNFTKGFPPVLLQVGTKEMLLSDSVRFYQAVKRAGGEAQLDIYEGMPHVFMAYMMGTPEQKAAYAQARRFWSRHLRAERPPVAAEAMAASPVVTLASGRVAGEETGGILIFRGIPYAAPPVGALRWRAPQPASSWSRVRAARKFGPACPQGVLEGGGSTLPFGGAPEPTSEDCLTLNVWAPARAERPAPVMLFIHGGAGRIGSGSLPYYDGVSFGRDGIVLVTINYRLGALGAFAYPGLQKEAAAHGEPSGAYALMDQIAALAWVRRNIAAFDGDPGNVTVFGESSGAISVFNLLVAPAARGLFERAIIESGGGWFPPPPDLESAEKRGREVAAAAGAPAGATLAQLRQLSAAALARVSGEFLAPSDPRLVSESPTVAVAAGRCAHVPLIIGVTDGEDSLINRAIKKAVATVKSDTVAKLSKLYGVPLDREMAARLEFRDGIGTAPARWVAAHWPAPAYLYRFTHLTESYRPARQRAPHGAELFYVFQTLGREPDEASSPASDDEGMASEVHARWVAFARTSRPDPPGMTPWPAYSAGSDPWMVFGQDRADVEHHVLQAQLDWYEHRIAPLILYYRARAAVARLFRW
jgi:para-nitrobenzyl esterase